MKLNRRGFLRFTGLAGAGLAGTGMMIRPERSDAATPYQLKRDQEFNMHGYSAPKLDTVRIGLIGIGARGSGTAIRLASIDGVEIKALCDLYSDRVSSAIKRIQQEFPGRYNPDAYSGSEHQWKQVCEQEDIDLIYIATPWHLHATMAIYAMEHNKHVYTELPVGVTIEECWKVVETSERNRRHCYMGCGSCHDGMNAVLLNMVRQGFFGDIIHAEGHYIHDRVSSNEDRWVRDRENHDWFGYRPWRLKENIKRNGNLYPAHGLGPAAQMMDLNYGDQMDFMVSISSNDFTMGRKMEELADDVDPYYQAFVDLNFRGNMNTSIIRTARGRTLMLQHDISSPRPGYRFHLISGTRGIYSSGGTGRPVGIATSDSGYIPEEEFNALVEKYTPAISRLFREKQNRAGGHGRGYARVEASDWRLIDCLHNGIPLEVDVYDGALWSAVTPLSEWSVAHQGASVNIPDFTNGAWKKNGRGMDVDLHQGGSTDLI